ncbi:hypothetical protein M406DRAFT_330871 [Cryphonectria parasitica EP155]|uniref:GPI inositol-deacylase winged helix domain-containing protein n=1 Tax=Cryphonectria parasitica (strain ATCC 38755 / EP155) TaxID=660469 RepID=A0A9P5CNP7_CRYP1|nr:uncharacterized protein M406DRAFT_330871 [Cryphonectria parasitica EP155]KAF3764537.1 hypothetical protein M406DRAFT_330871 [Cryphonectria parasitica EP155]
MERELAVLPEDLDSAYHRIIVRLGKQKDRRMVEQTRRLLGWIACSPSPLTIEEAHQALVVRPDDRNQVFNMVAKLDVVEFLGPIVETADGYIRFVHFTAKEYVTSSHLGAQLIDLNLATMDLAVRCIGYLCQQHHDPDMPPDERSKHVLTGQYSFHAFSTKMWFELVYLSKVDEDEIEGESRYNSEDEADFEALKRTQPLLYGLLCRISQFRNSYSLSTGKMSQETRMNNLMINL